MLSFVGEQRLLRRKRRFRRAFFAVELVMREAEAIIEVTDPVGLGNAVDTLDLILVHEFAADIAFGNEGKIVFDLSPAFVPSALKLVPGPISSNNSVQVVDLGVTS
jgi:hypothetical protein